jgi:hypothetical protein
MIPIYMHPATRAGSLAYLVGVVISKRLQASHSATFFLLGIGWLTYGISIGLRFVTSAELRGLP